MYSYIQIYFDTNIHSYNIFFEYIQICICSYNFFYTNIFEYLLVLFFNINIFEYSFVSTFYIRHTLSLMPLFSYKYIRIFVCIVFLIANIVGTSFVSKSI